MRTALGRYIVVDSEIRHGQPTLRGTRILVSRVLEQVAERVPWEEIRAQWRGAINQVPHGS